MAGSEGLLGPAAVMNLVQPLSVWMKVVGAGVGEIDEELLVRLATAEGSRDLPFGPGGFNRWVGTRRRADRGVAGRL